MPSRILIQFLVFSSLIVPENDEDAHSAYCFFCYLTRFILNSERSKGFKVCSIDSD